MSRAEVAGMSTPTESTDGIEQVREILVGTIHRDLEHKLSRLETRVTTRLGEIQQEARRRTEVIEGHLRSETEQLSARLEGELIEMREALRAITREHREAISHVEQRVTKLEETFVRAQHETREQILAQAKSFLDELCRTREELSDAVSRELGSLELVPEEPEHRAAREDTEKAPH